MVRGTERPDHQRVLEDVVERRLRQPLAPPPPRLNDELHGLLHLVRVRVRVRVRARARVS